MYRSLVLLFLLTTWNRFHRDRPSQYQAVQPPRGTFRVVERNIGWLIMQRRLARDYETLTASSEAIIHLASIDNIRNGSATSAP
ncbi:hypothetical protein GCM10022295_90940 [Streptomyces osmaniensis]|uniref:Transposase n=1 Tax=Streptomyces osmaniensis TaxID=593134 RepID=A0ABP6Z278_9ACTN